MWSQIGNISEVKDLEIPQYSIDPKDTGGELQHKMLSQEQKNILFSKLYAYRPNWKWGSLDTEWKWEDVRFWCSGIPNFLQERTNTFPFLISERASVTEKVPWYRRFVSIFGTHKDQSPEPTMQGFWLWEWITIILYYRYCEGFASDRAKYYFVTRVKLQQLKDVDVTIPNEKTGFINSQLQTIQDPSILSSNVSEQVK
eukprot:GHVQ01001804.1.p1 GENE.GHVQ01001804.1~~GHVQ01001804.1.p1  ORF type:complete len:199 (-),score=15.98 GHVQ01001804.1:683-1279(-)